MKTRKMAVLVLAGFCLAALPAPAALAAEGEYTCKVVSVGVYAKNEAGTLFPAPKIKVKLTSTEPAFTVVATVFAPAGSNLDREIFSLAMSAKINKAKVLVRLDPTKAKIIYNMMLL